MRSKINILFLGAFGIFALGACTNLKTREDVKKQQRPLMTLPTTTPQAPPPATGSSTTEPTSISPMPVTSEPPMETTAPPGEDAPHVEFPPTSGAMPAIPRIGVILGPGGARAFGHVGVLQEFQREKIPVIAVGGIEWGSPIAALYSGKGLANEAEWQMSKLKTEDVRKRSLIGASRPADLRSLDEFLKLAFGKSRAEDGKLPFACPAYNLQKNQVYLMSRGSFEQMLPYCLAYPPTFKPWQGNVAGVRDVKLLADQLRARGANVIVLINVLPPPNPSKPIAGDEGSAEAVLWNEISALYAKPLAGVDHVLTVPLGDTGLLDFDERREILRRGSENGSAPVRQLARRLGL